LHDKEYNQQVRRLERRLSQWLTSLKVLNGWRIHFHYMREDTGNGEGAYIARTKTEWEYLSACTEWSMPVVARTEDVDLDNAILHELMHVFLAELLEPGAHEKTEERVCSSLAAAIAFLATKWERNCQKQKLDFERQLKVMEDESAKHECT
jgi:hypothetical protein